MPTPLTRRTLLGWSLGGALLAACGRSAGQPDASLAPTALAPTPQIPDDDAPPPLPEPATCGAPTADNLEGPFYKPGAPHRASLIDASTRGERLALGGVVVGAGCRPLAGAILELWQADADGGYDLAGWGLRGRLRTDARGRWQASTIVPGRYLNGPRYRPRHIHVKLFAPGHVELTTQLYFDGDPYNRGDDFFVPSLVMANTGRGRAGFDFVLAAV